MENNEKNETWEEVHKKTSSELRVVALARAMMQRANRSGMPKQMMRINRDEFRQLLCPIFHKEKNKTVDQLTGELYDKPFDFLKKYPIIAIDGGKNFMSRKRAGCAILYRLLACDKDGLYKDFGEVNETFKRFSESEEIVDNKDLLGEKDILFLNEFTKEMLQKSPSSISNLWDAILEKRYDRQKTTIFSFTKPLPSSSTQTIDDQSCGLFMPLIVNHDVDKELKILRIRVK